MNPTIESITQQTNNRYLNMFELKGTNSKNKPFTYYAAARHESVESYAKSQQSEKIDAVCMFAVDEEAPDTAILIKQYRYPVGDYVYELPSGLVDPGETPQEAAIREFREETGLGFTITGENFGAYYPSCGMTNEKVLVLYGAAWGHVSTAFQSDDEDIEVVRLSQKDVPDFLRKNKVAMACAMALQEWYARGPENGYKRT